MNSKLAFSTSMKSEHFLSSDLLASLNESLFGFLHAHYAELCHQGNVEALGLRDCLYLEDTWLSS